MFHNALRILIGVSLLASAGDALAQSGKQKIIHDAEYYILEVQNGKKWAAEDRTLNAKIAELRKKHGRPPNIIHILWDDMTFGAVGFPRPTEEFWIHHTEHQPAWLVKASTSLGCTPNRRAPLLVSRS